MVALKMGLWPDAIEALRETLKRRPADAIAMYGLGRAFMEHSQFDDARRQFVGYLELRPRTRPVTTRSA